MMKHTQAMGLLLTAATEIGAMAAMWALAFWLDMGLIIVAYVVLRGFMLSLQGGNKG